MTLEEQDAVLGKLIRERNELIRERTAIDNELQPYAELFSRLSGEMTHDRYSALVTLKKIDTLRCADLLGQWGSVCDKIRDHAKRISEMGG